METLNATAPGHPVIDAFPAWTGYVEPGFSPDFLGVLTRGTFAGWMTWPERTFVWPSRPAFDEEYFEWIDVLEAVVHARGQFTMIELGAGWGRWLVIAATALRQRHPDLPCQLIGVEPEPTHFRYMQEHFRDNGFDPDRFQLIQAAVSDTDGEVWFQVGQSEEWYGQSIVTAPPPERAGESVRRVRAISLTSLLEPLEHVDLIDLDVQGTELAVLRAAREQVDLKVKRVHIGTHSRENEDGLRTLFRDLGWCSINDYPLQATHQTPWGPIEFGDGVQTWINPRFRLGIHRPDQVVAVRVPVTNGSVRPDTDGVASLADTSGDGTTDELERPEREVERLQAALDVSEEGREAVKRQLAAARAEARALRAELRRLQRAQGKPGRASAAVSGQPEVGRRPGDHARRDELRQRLAAAHAELTATRRELAALRASRVWRLAQTYRRARALLPGIARRARQSFAERGGEC